MWNYKHSYGHIDSNTQYFGANIFESKNLYQPRLLTQLRNVTPWYGMFGTGQTFQAAYDLFILAANDKQSLYSIYK